MKCKYCQSTVEKDAVICVSCGRQIRKLKVEREKTNSFENSVVVPNLDGFGDKTKPKNKTIALLLCLLGVGGIAGLHKLYEGKTLLGFIYMLTGGLFMIGTAIDVFKLFRQTEMYKVV